MFDSVSRSNPPAVPDARVPTSVRGDSVLRACFARTQDRTQERIGDHARAHTHVARIHERGSLRLRFPRTSGQREAVIVNTGGGITGGDRLTIELQLEAGAALTATSQAAEKIYRTDSDPARITITARLDDGARLDWLPQETILFERAAVERTLDIEMAASARLTMLECLVLGRIAHGEVLHDARWRDRWRIRRDGRLVFAEDLRLSGDIAVTMERAALGDGARALATLLHIAPDAHARLDAVRVALADGDALCGASAWNGMLIVRFASADPRAVRDSAIRATMAITDRPLPRAWGC